MCRRRPCCHHRTVAPTLLIVDDHAGFRTFARALLEAEGFDVVGEAADGASAVFAAELLDPQIVLLDIVLPDLDGFEVCARLTERGGAARGHPHLQPRRHGVCGPARPHCRPRVHPQGQTVAHRTLGAGGVSTPCRIGC